MIFIYSQSMTKTKHNFLKTSCNSCWIKSYHNNKLYQLHHVCSWKKIKERKNSTFEIHCNLLLQTQLKIEKNWSNEVIHKCALTWTFLLCCSWTQCLIVQRECSATLQPWFLFHCHYIWKSGRENKIVINMRGSALLFHFFLYNLYLIANNQFII